MITNYLSNSIVKGGKSPVFGTPGDFGLAYEDVTFQANDGVTLSGWLVRGGTDKIVIQTHFGVQCSRSGYTPEGKGRPRMWSEDIPFLKHINWLVDHGYSVLAYDFRNHGASDSGTCEWGHGALKSTKTCLRRWISSHNTTTTERAISDS